MRWALNSSQAVPFGELRAHLDAEMQHQEQVLTVRLMRNALARAVALANKQEPEPEQDSPTSRNASHDAMFSQMAAGILAAMSVAGAMDDGTKLFNVTLSGHVDPNDRDGVTERLQVFVDTAKSRVAVAAE